jgi:hypothetical protein
MGRDGRRIVERASTENRSMDFVATATDEVRRRERIKWNADIARP